MSVLDLNSVELRLVLRAPVERHLLEVLVYDQNPYISWHALSTLRRMRNRQLTCAA